VLGQTPDRVHRHPSGTPPAAGHPLAGATPGSQAGETGTRYQKLKEAGDAKGVREVWMDLSGQLPVVYVSSATKPEITALRDLSRQQERVLRENSAALAGGPSRTCSRRQAEGETVMQFYCRHCGEVIQPVESGLGCPRGCEDPFPAFPQWAEPEHFTREQMQCACCGECDLDERLLPALEKLRKIAKAEIEIVCAYRCEKQNAEARGVSKAAHMQGRAADIRIAGKTLQEMYDLAERVHGFESGGIGVHEDGTLHVDLRVFKARWGRVAGKYVGIEGSKLLHRW
jgi:hypothetical protein